MPTDENRLIKNKVSIFTCKIKVFEDNRKMLETLFQK